MKPYFTFLLFKRRLEVSKKLPEKFEVIKMDGQFYDLDEWLKMVGKTPSREGAEWWLGRIRARSQS